MEKGIVYYFSIIFGMWHIFENVQRHAAGLYIYLNFIEELKKVLKKISGMLSK